MDSGATTYRTGIRVDLPDLELREQQIGELERRPRTVDPTPEVDPVRHPHLVHDHVDRPPPRRMQEVEAL